MAGLDGVASGVEQGAWGTAGVDEEEGGAREAQRRSLSTVRCKVMQGRASVERAKLCGTLLMSTLFTLGEREAKGASVNTTIPYYGLILFL